MQQKNRQGYYYIDLTLNTTRKRFYVHRLVAKCFIDNTLNKPCVNHIDGNKLNNNVNNLEWVTYKENTQHAIKTGLLKHNITEEQKNRLRKMIIERCAIPIVQIKDGIIVNRFPSSSQASRDLGYSQGNISNAIKTKKKAYGYYWEYEK